VKVDRNDLGQVGQVEGLEINFEGLETNFEGLETEVDDLHDLRDVRDRGELVLRKEESRL
jgi:hypothetical protein